MSWRANADSRYWANRLAVAGAIAVPTVVSSGEAARAPDLAERMDHRIRRLVRVFEGLIVGQHRNVQLVDVTPHGHVDGAARRKHSNGIDLAHWGAADVAALPRTRHVGDRDVHQPVVVGAFGLSAEHRRCQRRRQVLHHPALQLGTEQIVAFLGALGGQRRQLHSL